MIQPLPLDFVSTFGPVSQRGVGRIDNYGRIMLHQDLEIPELEGLRAVAVVPVRNEDATLGLVLDQLRRLPLSNIVVVVNGSLDSSAAIAYQYGCSVIEEKEPLGHDVGRAVGAMHAGNPDILLFADADVVCLAEEYRPFLVAAATGIDVALNDVGGSGPVYYRLHPVNVAKTFLNLALSRPELGVSSLTNIPHALSKRALETITAPRLAIPPVAQAWAVLEGLEVHSVASIDVIHRNRVHGADAPERSALALERLILGDHLEALSVIQQWLGPRGIWTDQSRQPAER